jgi:putative DNA primase/helicase
MGADAMFERIDRAEPSKDQTEDQFQPMPVPPGLKKHEISHFKLGKPSAVWPYYNDAGLLDGYMCRFESTDSDGKPDKTFLPHRYGSLRNDGQAHTGWHWKGWRGVGTPFYGRPELSARPNDPVLIVEGEKEG